MAAVARDTAPDGVRVALPGGLWRGRARAPLREVALRPVGESDAAYLLESAGVETPSRRADALLARCIVYPRAAETFVPELTVGDREALLLHLRRLTFGDLLDCVLRCPAEECDQPMDLELPIGELLLAPYSDVGRTYDVSVDADGDRYDVTFRLPRAADLAAAVTTAAVDPGRATRELFEGCVVRAAKNGSSAAASALPRLVVEAVELAMADRDPQAELVLSMSCPTCGAEFTAVFDTTGFFLHELDARAEQLVYDVHALARHYHWSEREILAMSAGRRARYLELVVESTAAARAT